MTKMRSAMPAMFAGLVVMFVAYIVLEWGMNISGSNRFRTAAGDRIGSVNGHDISYKEFEAEYTQQLDQQKEQRQDVPEDLDQQVREFVWDRFVNDAFMTGVLNKLGLDVSDDEVRDVLIENPPAYLRRQFTDSLGNFDLAAYQSTIAQIANYQGGLQGEQAGRMDTMYNALLKIEESVRLQRQQEKFQSVVASAALVTDHDVYDKFFNDNAKVDVAYAFYDMNTIPDDAVAVSDADVKAYYDKHPDEFQQKPTRKAKYAFMYQLPSMADTLAVQRKLSSLIDSLRSTTDTARLATIFNQFCTRYNELETQNDAFLKIGDVSPNKAFGMLSTPVGGYSNAVSEPDGYHVYHILEGRPGETEYAHFQQIVLPFGTNKDSVRLRAVQLIEQMATLKEATFELAAQRFSVDQSSAARGGDVGYVAKGKLPKVIDDVVFSAPLEKTMGPIESDMGWVILRVHERGNREVRVKDLKMTIHISSQTKQMVEHQAMELHDRVAKGENFDSAAAKLKIRAFDSQPLTHNTPLLGSPEFTAWVFASKQGEVSEPKKLRGNTVVLYVSEVLGKGTRPFDEVKGPIHQKLVFGKKLDNLMVRANSVASNMRGDSIEHLRKFDSTAIVQFAANVQPHGALQGIGNDFAFNAAAYALENINQMSAPVRGTRGVYILQLRRKALPTDSMFVLQKDIIRNSLLQSRKTTFVQQWMEQQKETATIVDDREKFFRY